MSKNDIISKGLCLALSAELVMLAPVFSAENSSIEEVISSTTRQEKLLSDLSGNIDVITSDEVSFVKPSHFNELAVRLAGVNFSRNSGQEYLAAIRSPIFSGAGACGAFLMAQDNIPLRSAGFCNVNELFEAFTEQAERIEVVKGPGSALYGSNALHGMINVITPKADNEEGKVSLEMGAYDYFRFNFSKGFIDKKSGLRISSSITHDGGFRLKSEYDQQKINLRHDYQGEKWDISSNLYLTNLDQETAGYISGKDAFKDAVILRSNPNPEAFRKARSLRYWSQFSTELRDKLQWKVTPYVRVMNMELRMHFIPGQPLEESHQTSFGLQNNFYVNAGEKIEIITGFDLEYTQGSLQQTQDTPTQGSAFLEATIPSGKQYDYNVDSYMLAAFMQGDVELTPKLFMTAGVRLEYIRYDYSNNMLSGRTGADGVPCGFGGCRYSRPEDRKDDFTAFSPKVGLLYKYHENHHAFVNLSHGFRAPQATELYRLQRAQTVAELNNVSLKNLEAGLRGEGKGWTYNIAFYAMEKENYIFRDVDFFNVNGGKSDHLGADITLGFDMTDQISLKGNISLARHRYDFDYISNGINLKGKRVDSAPNEFGGLQLSWSPFERISAELEWVHMGSYYLDPENLHQYEGHDYFNVRGSVELSERAQISFRVMNLTNRKYAERADYTSFTDERYFPAKPRSIYVEVVMGF